MHAQDCPRDSRCQPLYLLVMVAHQSRYASPGSQSREAANWEPQVALVIKEPATSEIRFLFAVVSQGTGVPTLVSEYLAGRKKKKASHQLCQSEPGHVIPSLRSNSPLNSWPPMPPRPHRGTAGTISDAHDASSYSHFHPHLLVGLCTPKCLVTCKGRRDAGGWNPS